MFASCPQCDHRTAEVTRSVRQFTLTDGFARCGPVADDLPVRAARLKYSRGAEVGDSHRSVAMPTGPDSRPTVKHLTNAHRTDCYGVWTVGPEQTADLARRPWVGRQRDQGGTQSEPAPARLLPGSQISIVSSRSNLTVALRRSRWRDTPGPVFISGRPGFFCAAGTAVPCGMPRASTAARTTLRASGPASFVSAVLWANTRGSRLPAGARNPRAQRGF